MKPTSSGDRQKVDYCIIRHAYYPLDNRERKHANALVEAGYSVDVICLRDKGESPIEDVAGVRVIRLPLQHKRGGVVGYILEYGLSFWLMTFVLLYRFLRYRYKVVQVSTMPDFLVFAAVIPKLLGARVLLDLHEPTPELWLTKFGNKKGFLYWAQAKVEQWAIRFADRSMTVTPTLRRRFVERGADESRIAIVSNVCDSRIFDPSKHAGKQSTKVAGRFALITHGLIEERLGHATVIQAVSKLRDRIPGIHFEIPGFGEYESVLKDLVKDLNCQDVVTFLGYLPFADLLTRLHQADIGIVAMLRNPYSELIDTNKMYEYISMRKPVIVSRLLGVEENFDDTCMKLFEPENADELAQCILELYQNPTLAQTLAENAYARMQFKTSWDKTKLTFLNLVNELVSMEQGGLQVHKERAS